MKKISFFSFDLSKTFTFTTQISIEIWVFFLSLSHSSFFIFSLKSHSLATMITASRIKSVDFYRSQSNLILFITIIIIFPFFFRISAFRVFFGSFCVCMRIISCNAVISVILIRNTMFPIALRLFGSFFGLRVSVFIVKPYKLTICSEGKMAIWFLILLTL